MKTNFNKLRDLAHNNAVSKGFWDAPTPSVEHFLMLIITELSEVVEADRKNRVLDKDKELEFKNYDNLYKDSKEWTNHGYINLYDRYIKGSIQEEVADVVIRILDLAGGLGVDIGKIPHSYVELHRERIQSYSVTQNMFFLCQNMCLLSNTNNKEAHIRNTIAEIIAFSETNEIDLIWHIEAKMRYNKTRSVLHNKKY